MRGREIGGKSGCIVAPVCGPVLLWFNPFLQGPVPIAVDREQAVQPIAATLWSTTGLTVSVPF